MQVTSIVACMLEAGSEAIVGHLFGDCDLLGWLLNAPAQCQPEQRPGDDRCLLSNPQWVLLGHSEAPQQLCLLESSRWHYSPGLLSSEAYLQTIWV